MRSLIGLILIIGGIILGYFGYDKYQNSSANVKIGNAEISIGNENDKTSSYIMMGGGVILVIAGAIMLSKKGK